jgi:hypothetical protein
MIERIMRERDRERGREIKSERGGREKGKGGGERKGGGEEVRQEWRKREKEGERE